MSITISESYFCKFHKMNLHSISFFNRRFKTNVCHTAREVNSWFDYVVYLNDEAVLTFGMDIKYNDGDRPAVLQFCLGGDCLVFQLHLADEIPKYLTQFLDHPKCEFVGFGIKEHAENLDREYGIKVRNIVDIRDLAADYSEKDCIYTDLESIVRVGLDLEIEKPENVDESNWTEESLSLDQIKHASTEVIALHELKHNRSFYVDIPEEEITHPDIRFW